MSADLQLAEVRDADTASTVEQRAPVAPVKVASDRSWRMRRMPFHSKVRPLLVDAARRSDLVPDEGGYTSVGRSLGRSIWTDFGPGFVCFGVAGAAVCGVALGSGWLSLLVAELLCSARDVFRGVGGGGYVGV